MIPLHQMLLVVLQKKGPCVFMDRVVYHSALPDAGTCRVRYANVCAPLWEPGDYNSLPGIGAGLRGVPQECFGDQEGAGASSPLRASPSR